MELNFATLKIYEIKENKRIHFHFDFRKNHLQVFFHSLVLFNFLLSLLLDAYLFLKKNYYTFVFVFVCQIIIQIINKLKFDCLFCTTIKKVLI